MTTETNEDFLVEKINSLPPLSNSLIKINSLASDLNNDLDLIAEIINYDLSLSMNLLKLVNSSFYGFSRQIDTISQALVIIGFSGIQSLTMGISVLQTSKDIINKFNINLNNFWLHSIAVASYAKILAKLYNIKNIEAAFVAGLIHDIGHLIFIISDKDKFLEMLSFNKTNNKISFDLEKEFFYLTHQEAGYKLAEYWQLPEYLCNSILKHHSYPINDSKINFNEIIFFANLIAKMNFYGSDFSNNFNEIENLSDNVFSKIESLEKVISMGEEEIEKSRFLLSL